MNIKRYITLSLLFAAGVTLSSCNDFLDVVPDNRTELDSEDKIVSMLVSAYSDYPYFTSAEFSSDNVDKLDVKYVDSELYISELAKWKDVTEAQNDAPSLVWQGQYGAISTTNAILDAIENYEGELTDRLKAAKGEALICRAYAHFILANLFCHAYSPEHAATDLGLPYMQEAETTLNPKYERGTLEDFYAKMELDVAQGLTLISDNIATVPKYHFGVKSANAFAARFYLYYQKWDKAIECASRVLGSNPANDLRDLVANKEFGTSNNGYNYYATLDYVNSKHKCNLLLVTGMSQMGLAFGPFQMYTEYNHGTYLAFTETFYARTAPWGEMDNSSINQGAFAITSGVDKRFFARVPYLFEYQDEVAGIGYARTVTVPFTVDETLLTRAEAYVMSKQYDKALADMNIWLDNYLVNVDDEDYTLTEAEVTRWAKRTDYYKYDAPTIKKKFEAPAMVIEEGMQEDLMHISAYLRRLETLHTGLRFFDMKRYGYSCYRRELGTLVNDYKQDIKSIIDHLEPRDNRYAIQIPLDVMAAGFEPNPRN